MGKRITWIDSVKGIAILLVLLSHSMAGQDLFKNWVFAFHMPIFFIICGYIVNLKYSDGFKKGQFLDLLSKRWYNLLIPYFLFGLIYVIFLNVLKLYGGKPLVVLPYLKDLVSMKGIESLWFLPIYFFSEIVLVFFLGIFKGYSRYLIIALIVVVLSCIDQTTLSWPLSILYKVGAGSVFVFVGYLFASNKIENKLSLPAAILLLIIFSALTVLNRGASMNAMGMAPLYFINAIFINLAFISIVRILGDRYGNNELLTFYGKNSLIVICTNNVVLETIRLIDYRLFDNILLKLGYLGVFIFFIILTVCEYPLLKVFGGKFKRKERV